MAQTETCTIHDCLGWKEKKRLGKKKNMEKINVSSWGDFVLIKGKYGSWWVYSFGHGWVTGR